MEKLEISIMVFYRVNGLPKISIFTKYRGEVDSFITRRLLDNIHPAAQDIEAFCSIKK